MSGKAANLTRREIKLLVENLHINPAWLTTGKGDIVHRNAETQEFGYEVRHGHEVRQERAPYLTNRDAGTDFVFVPRYNVYASAGGGANISSELIVDHLAFKREWLAHMGLSLSQLALISVGGAIIHSEFIVDYLRFSTEWVTRMGLKPKKLALITVIGDSMEPALRNNDLVLID